MPVTVAPTGLGIPLTAEYMHSNLDHQVPLPTPATAVLTG
jgi:hypothetical protein